MTTMTVVMSPEAVMKAESLPGKFISENHIYWLLELYTVKPVWKDHIDGRTIS